LTLSELNTIAKTDCESPEVKIQALFSALTGLRRSHIQKLIWEELQNVEGRGYLIRFKQKKTGGSETLLIAEHAYGLLGERKQSFEKALSLLEAPNQTENRYLTKWSIDAGIGKKIIFHCFRRTFATLQLSMGRDIYSVSKMLNYKDLNTTQIYAKIIDETNRTDANRIKLRMYDMKVLTKLKVQQFFEYDTSQGGE
jgi:integrase